jgi:hypothetical protein
MYPHRVLLNATRDLTVDAHEGGGSDMSLAKKNRNPKPLH